MNDERKTPEMGNEDFNDNFQEDFDFGESQTKETALPVKKKVQLSNKVIIALVVVVIIATLILGYRIYKPKKQFVAQKPPVAEVPVQASNQAPATLTPQELSELATAAFNPPPAKEAPKQPPEPAPAPAPAPQTPPPNQAEVTKLQEGLQHLNTQIDSILGQIKYLDTYGREVSENLSKLNDAISTMDERLSALSNTTSTLSKDMGKVKNEVGHVKEVLKEDGLDMSVDYSAGYPSLPANNPKQTGRIAITEPEYTVHAVVPGRAWLKSLRGQIITVAEGDSLGNYGKILVIDAANGVVLTSSGVAFR